MASTAGSCHLSSPIIETPFASISSTVSASIEPNADYTVAEVDLRRVRQDLLNQTANDVLDEHGADAANAIFVQSGGVGKAACPGSAVTSLVFYWTSCSEGGLQAWLPYESLEWLGVMSP